MKKNHKGIHNNEHKTRHRDAYAHMQPRVSHQIKSYTETIDHDKCHSTYHCGRALSKVGRSELIIGA